MRNMRLCVACGLLVAAVAAVALPAIGRSATTRPHPLFGNPVLGNSAEIVTMWPTGTGGVDSLRITDFIPTPNPGWLSIRPSEACPGGPTDAKYQQLDVATGDFDGDGRDDIVAAYSMPTSNAWIQSVMLEIPDVRSGPLDWISEVTAPVGDIALERNAYRSPSNVRLATGNFDSDEPQEFVLGTRVQRNFRGMLDAYDHFGLSVAAIGDVDGDGIGDLVVGAPDDDDGGNDRGAVWILFLRSDGTVRSQQRISDTQGGFTGVLNDSDHFGSGVAALGNHDADGTPDIAVGAWADNDGGMDRGAVWLLHLNRDGTTKDAIKISSLSGNFTGPLDNQDCFGDRLVSIGDFDGNGYGDLAVAATWDDDGGDARGAVWLLFLNASGVDHWRKISDTSSTPGDFALRNLDRFGYGLAYFTAFNPAGAKVLAVGAPYDDDGGSDRGAVWLLFLNPDGSVASWTKLSSTSGNFGAGLADGDRFGMSVAAMPDQDAPADGCELAIGAPFKDDGGGDRGAVYLVYPNAAGTVKTKQKISDTDGNFTGAIYDADYFGGAVACPGDLDGDGKVDLVVGAYGADIAQNTQPHDTGDLWFVYLGTGLDVVKDQMENGTWWDAMLQLHLMELDGSRHPVTLASTFGQRQDDDLKESTRFDVAAGDFDGDGIDEIAVGGVRRRADNGNMELFVTVYAYDNGALVPRHTSTYSNQTQGNNASGLGIYFDHVAIATGRLRTALTDQILFSWSYREAEWALTSGSCGILPVEWGFFHTTRAYLATLIVDPVSWVVSGWGVDQKSGDITGDKVAASCEEQPPDPQWTGPSLGLAVGDLTDDGMDEVVWAALDKVYVYQLSGTTLQERTSVARARVYRDPGRRVIEIADLDATADADEWRAEIIAQDWGDPSSKQRIRVYQATTNISGVITGVAERWTDTPLYDTHVSMTQGDVALAYGDFDGDGVRIGGPPKGPIDVTNVIQPVVFLGTPPVHFDVFEQPYDLSGCFPGGALYACATDFQAIYERETQVAYACSTLIRSDWGRSTELRGWAEGFDAKVDTKMKATYGEHFSRSGGQSHSYSTSSYTPTGGDDRILADVTSYKIWEYPVLDGVGNVAGHIAIMEPGSAVPSRAWYTYDEWANLSGVQAPMLTHEPGNVLSYPDSIPLAGEYGDLWKADIEGWTVAVGTGPPHAFDLRWGDLSSMSGEESWEAGIEVGRTFTYEVEDPVWDVKAGISVSVDGSYDASELTTHSVSVSEDIHLGVTLGYLGGAAQAPYRVYPYVYRSKTTGALVLDYRVELGEEMAEDWWDRYRDSPDLTFMLPRLHTVEKGFPPYAEGAEYRSPDIRLMPDRVTVGDTITIRAVVRNYSLHPSDSVTVRFFVGDPNGEHTPIYDVNGQTVFTTADSIPAREKTPVTIRWIVPSNTPDLVRVYAHVDPDDAVTEVHEYNNKGYALLRATGGMVDVPTQVAAGVPFRLEQSVPNPFRGATMIAFGLPERTRVELKVYDIAGRLITTIVDAELAPGRHEFRWDGRGRDGSAARPGIYLYRINAGAFGETRRLVRLN